LPAVSDLRKTFDRWNRPSQLLGLDYDVTAFKTTLTTLLSEHLDEFNDLPTYKELSSLGYGPGYSADDALLLYLMLRHNKPRRYLEVGSGISTFYASLAAAANHGGGNPMGIQCIEPYPYAKLRSIAGIEIMKKEVQDVDISVFSSLEAGDVLFIDSSHVVRIDGDVPFIYLEVLPLLSPGVLIHIHDISFPFNFPYPPQRWVFDRNWPFFWNEAMLLQAFLAFNSRFEIVLSAPLVRYHDEAFLAEHIPGYQPVSKGPETFSSIWLRVLPQAEPQGHQTSNPPTNNSEA
jgi:predicted O-methyltransferase YrrM